MPDEQLTYKQIVHKIIYDSGYAKEIADLIVRARSDPPIKRRYAISKADSILSTMS